MFTARTKHFTFFLRLYSGFAKPLMQKKKRLVKSYFAELGMSPESRIVIALRNGEALSNILGVAEQALHFRTHVVVSV